MVTVAAFPVTFDGSWQVSVPPTAVITFGSVQPVGKVVREDHGTEMDPLRVGHEIEPVE